MGTDSLISPRSDGKSKTERIKDLEIYFSYWADWYKINEFFSRKDEFQDLASENDFKDLLIKAFIKPTYNISYEYNVGSTSSTSRETLDAFFERILPLIFEAFPVLSSDNFFKKRIVEEFLKYDELIKEYVFIFLGYCDKLNWFKSDLELEIYLTKVLISKGRFESIILKNYKMFLLLHKLFKINPEYTYSTVGQYKDIKGPISSVSTFKNFLKDMDASPAQKLTIVNALYEALCEKEASNV